jgi:hypothetical protein
MIGSWGGDMKIIFYSPAFKTKRASHRLRGDRMATEIKALGYDAVAVRTLPDTIEPGSTVIFLKYTQPEEIHQARAQGAFTIYDLCDNKFDERPEFLPCCQAADVVTVNSVQMGISVKNNTGRDSTVIPDPAERPQLPARFQPSGPIKLLWYGSSASLKFVPWVLLWQQLEAGIGDYEFTIISAKSDRIKNKMISRQNSGVFRGVDFNKINFVEWDWETQGRLISETDIILIPVVTENYRTDTKSANRLIDGLISGRFVVTTPLASYVEFDDYTWQKDYIEGIKWARANPDQVLDRVQRGQQYVKDNYVPAVIAQKWLHVIQDLSGQKQ